MDVLLRDAIVVSDDLVFEEVFDESSGDIVQIGLRGNVNLACGARLKVTKWMETRGRPDGDVDVRTIYYQYHAWWPKIAGKRQQMLVRYDQAHGSQPHRHQFDRNGHQVTQTMLTLDTMPRLDAVIREAAALAVASLDSESSCASSKRIDSGRPTLDADAQKDTGRIPGGGRQDDRSKRNRPRVAVPPGPSPLDQRTLRMVLGPPMAVFLLPVGHGAHIHSA
jgi:hypothetical protein